MSVELERVEGWIRIAGERYRLRLADDPGLLSIAPYVYLEDADGVRWSKLSLLASVHASDGRDETLRISAVEAAVEAGEVVVRIDQESTRWSRRSLTLRCTSTAVAIHVEVDGAGSIDDVLLLGGEAALPGGACGVFRSSIVVASLLVPVPTQPVAFIRSARHGAVLGVVGDADPGRLHGIFSPPPLVLGLGRPVPSSATEPAPGEWLAVGVREDVVALGFTQLRYEPLDGGFLLRLAYEGHTAVDGSWRSPRIVLQPVDDGWAVLDAHRADLLAHGYATPDPQPLADWWAEPLFCGWGAQCARGVADGAPADRYARQDVYDEFLEVLDGAGLDPGTIVIDDRWQAEYGAGTVDAERWPELRAWVARQHAAGRRVLLWWKAWDPEGLPIEECIRDARGRPVAADPSHPGYLTRLRGIVAGLLGADGIGADGLKVDFTQRAPSGRTLRSHAEGAGIWGVAALHRLLAVLHEAAHDARPDALVVTHAVHPSFAGTGDMIRLNDVLERDEAGALVPVVAQLRARAEIARRSRPGVLIDTDQWPMPSRAEWLGYARMQGELGVPALYYLETIDNTGERIERGDLAAIAASWSEYRERRARMG